MPKTVFIAHPISEDPEGNTRKVLEICRQIHTADVIPVVPGLVWRMYLSAIDAGAKTLAKAVTEEYFRRGMIDEIWFYGDKLSSGTLEELKLAERYGVRAVAKSLAMFKILARQVFTGEISPEFAATIGFE
jgi:hypothetical protein